jgi:hypothetical protein
VTCAVDAAFNTAFGPELMLNRKHWAWPSLDKGQWSPKSLLIIYHEDGLPDEWSEPSTEKMWRKLERELSTRVFGFEVFLESINPAVSAVWRA